MANFLSIVPGRLKIVLLLLVLLSPIDSSRVLGHQAQLVDTVLQTTKSVLKTAPKKIIARKVAERLLEEVLIRNPPTFQPASALFNFVGIVIGTIIFSPSEVPEPLPAEAVTDMTQFVEDLPLFDFDDPKNSTDHPPY